MFYLIIERYRHGDPRRVYERFQRRGRLVPLGLTYVSSWVTHDLSTCYQVMETSDQGLLSDWMNQWSDLVEFEVIPVLASQEAANLVLRKRDINARDADS
jgi:hypothetical protein